MKPAIAEYLKERRVEPRMGEVLATCGKSRSSVYAGIKEGTFPAPVKLQGRSSAWLRSEVLRWMQACIEASRPVTTASSAIENSSGSRHIGNKGTGAEALAAVESMLSRNLIRTTDARRRRAGLPRSGSNW